MVLHPFMAMYGFWENYYPLCKVRLRESKRSSGKMVVRICDQGYWNTIASLNMKGPQHSRSHANYDCLHKIK